MSNNLSFTQMLNVAFETLCEGTMNFDEFVEGVLAQDEHMPNPFDSQLDGAMDRIGILEAEIEQLHKDAAVSDRSIHNQQRNIEKNRHVYRSFTSIVDGKIKVISRLEKQIDDLLKEATDMVNAAAHEKRNRDAAESRLHDRLHKRDSQLRKKDAEILVQAVKLSKESEFLEHSRNIARRNYKLWLESQKLVEEGFEERTQLVDEISQLKEDNVSLNEYGADRIKLSRELHQLKIEKDSTISYLREQASHNYKIWKSAKEMADGFGADLTTMSRELHQLKIEKDDMQKSFLHEIDDYREAAKSLTTVKDSYLDALNYVIGLSSDLDDPAYDSGVFVDFLVNIHDRASEALS